MFNVMTQSKTYLKGGFREFNLPSKSVLLMLQEKETYETSLFLAGVTMTLFRSHGRDACPISIWDLGSHTSAGN